MTQTKNSPSVLGVTRPPFLLLALVCVLLGMAVAHWEGQSVDALHAALVLLGGLAAHVSVNALNEYRDFRSGLDFRTEKTPFSGGSGTLVARPDLAAGALAIAIGALLVTLAVGLYFVAEVGWGLVPIGLAGVLIILAYTDWINRNRYLCLVAPGLGFGPLMVLGAHYVLTGGVSPVALIASLIPFFLVNNLLLLNQFPDIDADRSVGRENFPITAGTTASATIYVLFAAAAYVILVAAVIAGRMPLPALAALLTAVLAWHAWQGAARFGESTAGPLAFLRSNVIVALATPLLLSVGLYLS